MTGLWLEGRELRLATDLPVPEPPPGEALIRVRQAGICNTDIELVRGYYPYTGVLGHEFVGVVEQSPPGHEDLVGKRVVGEINAVCGTCAACTAGRSSHCKNRTVLGIVARDGAFAEYLTLPAQNLHLVPDSIPDEAAVFAEPLAAALQIREQIDVRARDHVLVVGDGKLGQFVARTLNATGCHLRVAGRHADKLALLAGLGIATTRVDTEGVPEAAAAPQPGEFDIAVECSGSPSGFALARSAVRPRGTIVMKSTYAERLDIDISSLVVDEVTLVGSRCGPFAPALQLLESGRICIEDLITKRYPLAAGMAAFEHARVPGTLKILLQVG